jgi:hypothetical protein
LGFQIAISSQNLKEIIESFKAQLFHTLDERLDVLTQGLIDSLTNIITDGLNDSFRSIQDSLNNMQEIFLMQGLRDEYNQEIYAWYDFEADCDDWYMDSCHFWMTTTSIFYLMTLLHLLQRTSMSQIRS